VWRTLIFLLIEAAAVIAITMWSRRPGWGDSQILALAAVWIAARRIRRVSV
jgi:hypothetical protein